MTAASAEQRKISAIARQYKRDGYHVTVPKPGFVPPSFLDGFTPDLIAESEQDRVVVEVKRSDQVRRSNDILDMAERVSQAAGWRFELVTIPPPFGGRGMSARRFQAVTDRVRHAAGLGMPDLAYVYAWSAVEALISQLAQASALPAAKASVFRNARDLLSRGVLTAETLHDIADASAIRDRLAQAEPDFVPAPGDLERLLGLAQQLHTDFAGRA